MNRAAATELLLLERGEELARIVTLENGKTLRKMARDESVKAIVLRMKEPVPRAIWRD